ncbi:MAG: hypothetical protein ABI969_09090 [bacterium]
MTAISTVAGACVPETLRPIDTAKLVPELARHGNAGVWVYRYTEATSGWRLSIATFAEPGSRKLSLGGFRIAPEARTSSPGFDSDREAIGLAMGMEEKVYWSRLMHVGGPLALRDTSRIVGGKCVLHPTPDARVGQPRDRELLDFAIACFQDVEARAGFSLTTGQDLGHGVMSDGVTSSLEYLNARFTGSVVVDTSKPTGEGNFFVLAGMLRGADVSVEHATVGLIGCGNIGMHVLGRLRERGAAMIALESSATRREEIAALGIPVFAPEEKEEFLRRPMDAVVVNASGGSLDSQSVALIAANDRLRIVCGSENLVMPDHAAGSEALRVARKAYAPTELGGMMGYLTAVEEYLARGEGVPFDVQTMMLAAKKLDAPSYEATRHAREVGFAVSFEDAMRVVRARGPSNVA